MKPFGKNKARERIRTRVTWLRNSPIPITELTRTPTTGAAVTVQVNVDVGETAATPGRAASCPPDIADNTNKPGSETGLEEDCDHAGAGEVGDVEEAQAVEMEHQDLGEDGDHSVVEAVSEHGGRPPQLSDVEPLQPRPNPHLQRWVRVRRRLCAWRLACHDQCGRVCSVRRQRRT